MKPRLSGSGSITLVLALVVAGASSAAAEGEPMGARVVLPGTVGEVAAAQVMNVARRLQAEAVREDRPAILVLEIHQGTSRFGQIRDLAKELTGPDLNRVRTVAWVPESISGNNVILALAANEIVMHPEAEIGDIGRGRALDRDDQQFVLGLVSRRNNLKVNTALAQGMMDPAAQVWLIHVRRGETTEADVVTTEELEQRRRDNEIIERTRRIWEAGEVGVISGETARQWGILVMHTADSIAELERLYELPEGSLQTPAGEEDRQRRVRMIRIDGMIDEVLESFLERQIQRCVNERVEMLIFEIDSFGGTVVSSSNLAQTIARLDEQNIRTVAWIPEKAYSGAAIVALGCDEIYMHPEAQIGDAGAIRMGPDQVFERVPEKLLSPLHKTLEGLAKRKNRPAALAVAMSDKDLVVYRVTHVQDGRVWYMSDLELQEAGGEWEKGPVVPETREGVLLTVDGVRAHELLLAKEPVRDLQELKARLGIPLDQRLVPVGRSWLDNLVFVLNTKQALFFLILIGVACIYLELHFMTGLLGIVSALCFAIFFWSRFLGGTAGWLEVVLFLLGLACIGLEIFVIPGFGVFGISGGLLVAASVVLASQEWGNGPDYDFREMTRTMATLSASIVSVIVLAMLLGRYLPRMPVLSHMVLTPPGSSGSASADEPRLRPGIGGESRRSLLEQDPSLVGKHGVTVSVLRPAGKAKIEGRYLDVVSEGPYIPPGTPIVVAHVSGNRVVVRQVEQA